VKTQCQVIVDAFATNGWKMSLGYILSHTWGYKCTSRFSDLRREGYVITLERGETPSQNVYTCIPPDHSGQLRMIA
jgi:hypothetical protein